MGNTVHVCPLCNTLNITGDFLHFAYASKRYELARCNDCECIFYTTEVNFDFKNDFNHKRSLTTFLEKDYNYEQVIRISYNFLNSIPDNLLKGLDIGCGAGIAMDFGQKLMKKDLTGFEPSSDYSKQGKEILKLNIIEDFFSSSHLPDQQFDFAICHQVLQMINNPEEFLSEIKHCLQPKGILSLSTPDNESINISYGLHQQFSTLSPGVHKILFNEKSLTLLLQKAGFKYVQVSRRDNQVYAIASEYPIGPVELFAENREIILSYYKEVIGNLPKESSYFKGIWYRYFRNRIDNGEYEDALILLKEATWFEIWSEEEITEHIHTSEDLRELNTQADAVIYYYTGIVFLNHLGKYDYAAGLFQRCFLLCSKIIQLQPEMSHVERDIIWLARIHYLLAKLYAGHSDAERIELQKIISGNVQTSNHLPLPSAEIKTKAQEILKALS